MTSSGMPLQIALFYYSSTGNTRLACRYIAHTVQNAHVDLRDVLKHEATDLSAYDVVGFATSTQFMGVPYRFGDFIKQLPKQDDKPAFVFNTYGAMSGQTLKVLAGHSLLMPENYPPLILKGWGNADAPNEKEVTTLLFGRCGLASLEDGPHVALAAQSNHQLSRLAQMVCQMYDKWQCCITCYLMR